MASIRDRIVMRFWMAAGELAKLAGLGDRWWDKVQGWLEGVIVHVDPDHADLELVELLGWQRNCVRFDGESDELFRARVKNALANAQDAGGTAGFARIFQRLQLGAVAQSERIDAVNWDVIELQVTDDQLAANPDLFAAVIRKYGRTCRRYTYTTEQAVGVRIRTFDFDHMQINSYAVVRR